MHEMALQTHTRFAARTDHLLKAAAQGWFAVTATGLWIFAGYVALLYVGSALRGDFDGWNQVFPRGYVPGDTLGNLAVGAHVFVAVVIIAGGPLQLIPRMRARFPAFHRWNGRDLALCRGPQALDPPSLGPAPLFLVVNAVWFFRIGLMAWLFIHRAPVGFDAQTFTGRFLIFLAFAQTLLPLAILELYLRAKEGGSARAKGVMAGGLLVVTAITGVGIFAATMGLWLPRM